MRQHALPLSRACTIALAQFKLNDVGSLYAIEAGVANNTDPALKERIDGLKAIRDQAQADVARAQTSLGTVGEDAVTPAMVARLAEIARKRMRIEAGGYRRDHL